MRRSLPAAVIVLVALSTLAAARPGAAAPILEVSGGELVGARNVDIGGTLYDVAFVEGTCIGLFAGCDTPGDFTFTTQTSARTAALALLDQVFVDGASGQFDSDPELTHGCADLIDCLAMIPYTVSADLFGFVAPHNVPGIVPGDGVFTQTFFTQDGVAQIRSFDTGTRTEYVYARFTVSGDTDPTPVPEPASLLLLGVGIAGSAASTRRRRSARPDRASTAAILRPPAARSRSGAS